LGVVFWGAPYRTERWVFEKIFITSVTVPITLETPFRASIIMIIVTLFFKISVMHAVVTGRAWYFAHNL
jgi:hypothetical protein